MLWVVWAGYVDGEWQEVLSAKPPFEVTGLEPIELARLYAVHRAAWDFERAKALERDAVDAKTIEVPAPPPALTDINAHPPALTGRTSQIHYLDCAPMRPYWPAIEAATCCLLVETDDGLLLVDTGFGRNDYLQPSRVMRNFQRLLRAPRQLEDTACEQVKRLGYDPGDVRHIVMTHLHLDHAGGLPDFPEAQIHIFRPEYEAAMQTERGFWEMFFRPEHWAHGPHWVFHDRETRIWNDEVERKTWYGFEAIQLEGISPRVALIPLTGHTPGHCGVAVETLSGWVLHCGDALPYGGPVNVPPEWFSSLLIGDHGPRLRALAAEHGDEVLLLSAHLPPAWMAALQRGERPY